MIKLNRLTIEVYDKNGKNIMFADSPIEYAEQWYKIANAYENADEMKIRYYSDHPELIEVVKYGYLYE
jgi:hypothetical protein